MIFGSVLAATLFKLLVVPIAYKPLVRRNSSPGEVKRRLEATSAPPQEA